MKTLGIIGFGTMGESFARGLRRTMPDLALAACDVRAGRVEAAGKPLGVAALGSAAEVFAKSDLAILCVKPQDLAALAGEARPHSRGKRVISILAGKRLQTLAECLATDNVARFMPNIAATVGNSLVGVSFGPGAEPGFRADCLAIAGALGKPMEIPEKLMAAMTGVSGSGIAYVLAFVHAMALGGVAAGFDYPTALAVAAAGLESAAGLLVPGAHPLELASRVASPAGTTIQGMRALEKGGFTAAVMEAVEAAARRATELET
jgi:pyrroline-5-carboxylate reductase